MAIPIIYCANGNPRFAETAIEAGLRYGAQLPGSTYYPLYFTDQDWKAPDRELYTTAVRKHHPHMATVLDWERDEQLAEVLGWAEEVAPYVEQVVIIPKVQGGVARLPHRIGGKEVVLGYSVPTKYGGTSLPLWEFGGWPVHLLGGSPQRQLHIAHYVRVNSADGNYAQRMAVRSGQFWMAGTAKFAKDRYWPRIQEADDRKWEEEGLPYEAFRRSCINMLAAWRDLESR